MSTAVKLQICTTLIDIRGPTTTPTAEAAYLLMLDVR